MIYLRLFSRSDYLISRFIILCRSGFKQTVACGFEDAYMCAYASTQPGSTSWVRVQSSPAAVSLGLDVDGNNVPGGRLMKETILA